MVRRGLTFIEVVVSLAMLSVFASLVLGSIGYLSQMTERSTNRLQAMELAHRVVVQYLDDQDLVPDPDQYVWQGDARYRVDIEEMILQQESTTVEGLSQGTSLDIEDVNLQQRVQSMHELTVSVYRWEPRNQREANVPVVRLTRHYSPFLQDEDWARDWLLDLLAERNNPPSDENENDDDPDDEDN